VIKSGHSFDVNICSKNDTPPHLKFQNLLCYLVFQQPQLKEEKC